MLRERKALILIIPTMLEKEFVVLGEFLPLQKNVLYKKNYWGSGGNLLGFEEKFTGDFW